MPTIEELENPKTALATEIISADSVVLGNFFNENRVEVRFDSINPHIIDALLSTEDIRFYTHSGIDFKALSRVAFKTVVQGKKSSGGGSTISQQLAKLLFPRERFSSSYEIAIRKFREWVIAVKLEKAYTKEEIITLYLNKYDFSHNANGIKIASEVYFNKDQQNLHIQEAAMLIGMLKNSSLFNPVRFPDTTIHRRNVVLHQMLRNDVISQYEFDSLKQLPLNINFHRRNHNYGLAPYFREWLRTSLNADKPDKNNYWSYEMYKLDSIRWNEDPIYGWCNKNQKAPNVFYDIYKDGLKIYTTIDSRMQKHAEKAMKKHMGETIQPAFDKENRNNSQAPFSYDIPSSLYKSRIQNAIKQSDRYRALKRQSPSWKEVLDIFNTKVPMRLFSWDGEIDTVMSPLDSILYMKKFLRSGLLSMEPGSGHVKAYVGGINYKYFKYDHIMQQRRQVGSTFKPFLYTLAMHEGMSPCKQFANVPTSFYINDTVWTPANADDHRAGKMVSLAWALATSNNYISAKLMQLLQPQPVIDMAHQMGVKTHIDPNPSICLGVADLSLYEMVGAYGTFPNQGIYTQPLFVTHIEDKHGQVISTFSPKQNEAISEETAYTMVNLLENAVNMRGGTSIALRFRHDIQVPLAGKTGTTNDHSDGWYIGFTPELVTGIWVGGEERSIRFRSFRYGQGARMALPMFAHYIEDVIADSTALGYHPWQDFEHPSHMDRRDNICDDQTIRRFGIVREEEEKENGDDNNSNQNYSDLFY
ncbi:MAG: transglycosylase domain-containing protein [Bacteroidales bacterium]